MQAAPAMESNNIVLTKRAIEELWNKGNLAIADELYATNFVRHDPDNPDLPRGPSGVKLDVTNTRRAFPNFHLKILDIIGTNDKVVVRWNATGTHIGQLRNLQPTGKEVNFSGITICRIENDKCQEIWVARDSLGLMKQIGVVAG
jgi:predicted ester cyclase